MSIESDMNETLKVMYGTDQMGQPITYTPPGGAAKTANAMVDPATVDTEDTSEGRYTVHRRVFYIIIDSDGIDQVPVNEAAVTFNGTNYSVESISQLDEVFATLECVRDIPTAKRHETFNKKL